MMKKRRSCFTAEAIRILRENPYTLNVTPSRLSLTLEAEKKILELYSTGMPCQAIIEELGYDPKMLGVQEMKNIVRNTRREAEIQRGLHQGNARSARTRMNKEDIEQLDYSPASYAKLKNEVIYLREEVEFLKKSHSR